MTEAEWLVATSPAHRWLEFLGSNASDRKLRTVWHRLLQIELGHDERPAHSGGVSNKPEEMWLTGTGTNYKEPLLRSRALDLRTSKNWHRNGNYDPTPTTDVLALLSTPKPYLSADAASCSASVAHWAIGGDIYTNCREFETDLVAEHTTFIRDIFGARAFRSTTADPAWLTFDVRAIARGIYESPRLLHDARYQPDALQDAGCDSADVLDHCRGPGPHVRGCWVVDLILGRE